MPGIIVKCILESNNCRGREIRRLSLDSNTDGDFTYSKLKEKVSAYSQVLSEDSFQFYYRSKQFYTICDDFN